MIAEHLPLPLDMQISPWEHPSSFPGVQRLRYGIDDGARDDWALAWPGERDAWVVHLHGHGSTGDQIFTRQDIRELWLSRYRASGFGVLSPNLRGNAWMCPAAVEDLRRLLAWMRETYGAREFYLLSGSMGGTGNLIYAALHPEDVAAVMALCPATDIGSYAVWLREHPGGIADEILAAIVAAYGGTPEEQAARYADHSSVRQADRLTMPLLLSHGDADNLIPIEQSRRLATALGAVPNLTYVEIPGGGHDAPLHHKSTLAWMKSLGIGE
ncbi:MAG: alpha/beta hydrolase family protein [Armatimonadota bacterium]